jgi:hypothetical protein
MDGRPWGGGVLISPAPPGFFILAGFYLRRLSVTSQKSPNGIKLLLSEVYYMSGHVQTKRAQPTHEQRKMRVQQIVFTVLAAILIFSMFASLLIKP